MQVEAASGSYLLKPNSQRCYGIMFQLLLLFSKNFQLSLSFRAISSIKLPFFKDSSFQSPSASYSTKKLPIVNFNNNLSITCIFLRILQNFYKYKMLTQNIPVNSFSGLPQFWFVKTHLKRWREITAPSTKEIDYKKKLTTTYFVLILLVIMQNRLL